MNVYYVSQSVVKGYDTFNGFVCIAESATDARELNPRGNGTLLKDGSTYGSWPETSKDVEVEFIGVSEEDLTRVVCS